MNDTRRDLWEYFADVTRGLLDGAKERAFWTRELDDAVCGMRNDADISEARHICAVLLNKETEARNRLRYLLERAAEEAGGEEDKDDE